MLCATIFALLLTACSSPSPATPTPVATGLSGVVEGKVDVGGYDLYYTCAGQGSPTVILEAGGPGDSTHWELVRVYMGAALRVCAYDRANLGKSDPAPKPRTFIDMTRDLHALLKNAPIEGPYVLVGHSMGGMLVRLYASQYPGDVVGLVLVDSAHPDMGDRLLAALPPVTAGESKALKSWRQYGTWMSTSNGRMPNDVEGVDMLVSNQQVREVKSLGDLPLAVISRSPDNPIMAAQMPSLPKDINANIMRLWQEMQTELEGLSSHSTRYTAVRSGHFVMLEEPRLVVEAIHHVINQYRTATGESIPPALDQTDEASHAPEILSVTQREEWQQGTQIITADIAFSDLAGDAITVINKYISASMPSELYDDIIRVPADEQKQGALISSAIGCSRGFELVVEYRVFDAVGNVSNPETVTFSCAAPKPYVSPTGIAGIAGLLALLGVGIWLLVRYLRRRRAAAPA
jgi:pimeloyl-ACP methyl ester carboxylesterase